MAFIRQTWCKNVNGFVLGITVFKNWDFLPQKLKFSMQYLKIKLFQVFARMWDKYKLKAVSFKCTLRRGWTTKL